MDLRNAVRRGGGLSDNNDIGSHRSLVHKSTANGKALPRDVEMTA